MMRHSGHLIAWIHKWHRFSKNITFDGSTQKFIQAETVGFRSASKSCEFGDDVSSGSFSIGTLAVDFSQGLPAIHILLISGIETSGPLETRCPLDLIGFAHMRLWCRLANSGLFQFG